VADNKETTSLVKRLRDSKMFRWVIGIPVALAIVLYTASYFLDEPLRSSMEKKLNQDLKGYSVRLPVFQVSRQLELPDTC
jgi:hypothetical protein